MRYTANIFLFLVIFGFTTRAVFRVMPPPSKMGTALEAFLEKKDSMSILFVGSSHTTHQVIPKIVDETLRERGLEHRSYVLGLGGATPHQMNFLLAEALRSEPANLALVVMEAAPWDYELDTTSWRGIWWHSPAQTWDVAQTVLATERSKADKWMLIEGHLRLAFKKNFCIGVGVKIFEPLSLWLSRWISDVYGFPYYGPPKKNDDLKSTFLEGHGYSRLLQKHGSMIGFREGDVIAPKLEFALYNPPGLQRQVDRFHRRGLKLVYLLSPTTIDHTAIQDLHDEGILPHLFDFNQPELYPALFVREHRFDRTHINHDGAEVYSVLVAERLADLFAQQPSLELAADM